MTFKAASVGGALALAYTLVVAPSAVGADGKAAGRMYLSSGDVLAVAFTETGSPAKSEATLVVREERTGTIVTVSENVDFNVERLETTISSGKHTVTCWQWYGFSKDGLAVPLQVRLGKTTYRVLLSESQAISRPLSRLQEAVRSLPSDFFALLQKLSALDSPKVTLISFPLIDQLTGVTRQPLSVVQSVKLQGSEADALIREAAARQGAGRESASSQPPIEK